jgi:hypothetical protein
MSGVYEGSFSSWEDVCFYFDEAISEPDQVIFAVYDQEMYEGYADVIYRVGDRFYWASGSHCSCYGLEDQWSPEEYSLDELVAALLRGRHFWWAADSVAVRDEVLERVSPESHSQPGHA